MTLFLFFFLTVALNSIQILKPINALSKGCKFARGFAFIASSIKESAFDEKSWSHGDDLSIRFSNVVSNLFQSNQSCDSEKKTSKLELSIPQYTYNKMMSALSRAGKVNEVIRLLREMKQSQCKPNVLCYNTVINALVMANRPLEARVVFKEIIILGLVPTVSTYNILVKLYCRLEKLDLALKVVDNMLILGCMPDSTTYSTLVVGLCRVGRTDKVWKVLDPMLQYGCRPSVYTYTPIVHNYCLEGNIQEAENLMELMENVGCPPNSVTYNILIYGLCKVEKFDKVEKILRESRVKGWEPNANTYNTYMNGLCKRGKHKEAIGLLDTMKQNELEPTHFSLSIFIDCLCRDSKIAEAKCLLDKSLEFKFCVGVVAYNTLMSWLSEIASWFEVLSLFTEMLKKGIAINTRTFNIVINSLCKGGKLLSAKCIFNRRRFVANLVTFNTLIHWCFEYREIDDGQQLFLQMNVEKIAPDTITYTIMVVGLCKEEKFSKAVDYYLRSVQEKFDQDLGDRLINNLNERRRFKELKDLYEGLKSFCIEGCFQSSEIYYMCAKIYEMLSKQRLFVSYFILGRKICFSSPDQEN